MPFGRAMFDLGFVFSVSRGVLKSVQTPVLLLYGNDRAHPLNVSVEADGLLPMVKAIDRWRETC